MMLKVLDVDGAARRVKGGWTSTGDPGPTTANATSASPPNAAANSRRCSTTSQLNPAARSTYATSWTILPPPLRPLRQLHGPPLARRCHPGEHDPRPRPPASPRRRHRPRRMWPTGVKDPRRLRPDQTRPPGRDGPGPRPPHRHRLGQPPPRPVRRPRHRRPRRPGGRRRQGPRRLGLARPPHRRRHDRPLPAPAWSRPCGCIAEIGRLTYLGELTPSATPSRAATTAPSASAPSGTP